MQKVLSPTSHTPSGSGSDSLVPAVQILPISRDPEAELRSHPSDPEADDAVLKSINPLFFGCSSSDEASEHFDPSLYELQVKFFASSYKINLD